VIRISPLKALLAASALASAAVLAACATASPPAETGQHAAGQRLYREHCGSCHRLRSPGEQTRERWAWAVKKYGDRAHLAPEDRPAVLDYLQARAKDAAPSTETR
jgi:mono/diheme cytochrome c family protein